MEDGGVEAFSDEEDSGHGSIQKREEDLQENREVVGVDKKRGE